MRASFVFCGALSLLLACSVADGGTGADKAAKSAIFAVT